MRLRIIAIDFSASVKTWIRSKGTLFWTLAFPVILIALFGAIFSGMEDIEYELYVQDLDDSEMSQGFIKILNETGVIEVVIVDAGKNISSYIKEENIKRLIVIPEGYQEKIVNSFVNPSSTVNLSFYFDPSEQTSYQVVKSIISNIVQSLNMNFSEGRNIIGIDDISTFTEEFDFIDRAPAHER